MHDRVIVGIVGLFVVLLIGYGIRVTYKRAHQDGLNKGASLMYRQMNVDLIEQLKLHYNPEKRTFNKWEEE